MNLNNTTKSKSTQELKDQVLTDIKKVRNDIDEIKNRMTPGQIIDDAIFYRRSNSPGETFTHLKNNPIGTSFLTLGTILLMEDAEHHTLEAIAREKAVDVKDRVQNKVEEVRENLQVKFKKDKRQAMPDTSVDLKESFLKEGTVEDLKSNVRQGMESAKERIGIATESAKGNIQNVKEKVKEGVDSAKYRVQDAYQSASSIVKNLDPLTYLVLGAGLGTITGAAIPLAEKEENFVDDKFQGKTASFRQDLEDALNKSANILKNEFIGGVTNIKLKMF